VSAPCVYLRDTLQNPPVMQRQQVGIAHPGYVPIK